MPRLCGCFQILKQRREQAASAPEWNECALRDLHGRQIRFEKPIRVLALVEGRFPGEDVESHLLMKESNQALLRVERSPIAVGLFAELNDAGISDDLLQGHQVGEVVVFRI